jgi:hypothetical protein
LAGAAIKRVARRTGILRHGRARRARRQGADYRMDLEPGWCRYLREAFKERQSSATPGQQCTT